MSLLALDRGAVRPATEAFDLTLTEVALLERAVPGEALIISAGERVFLDIVASPAEKQLFDTRPPSKRSGIGSGARVPLPNRLLTRRLRRPTVIIAGRRNAPCTSSTTRSRAGIARLRCQRGDDVHDRSSCGRPVTVEPTPAALYQTM